MYEECSRYGSVSVCTKLHAECNQTHCSPGTCRTTLQGSHHASGAMVGSSTLSPSVRRQQLYDVSCQNEGAGVADTYMGIIAGLPRSGSGCGGRGQANGRLELRKVAGHLGRVSLVVQCAQSEVCCGLDVVGAVVDEESPSGRGASRRCECCLERPARGQRNIPTDAGSRPASSIQITTLREHPYGCGEQFGLFIHVSIQKGTSPPVRGAVRILHRRGEDPKGTPPRVRRAGSAPDQVPHGAGNIPAGAESSRCRNNRAAEPTVLVCAVSSGGRQIGKGSDVDGQEVPPEEKRTHMDMGLRDAWAWWSHATEGTTTGVSRGVDSVRRLCG